MEPVQKTASRGRPPTITRERIAQAGIDMGLLNITFVGLAAEMGVSHMALYKHVPSLKALKTLVAETLFLRWEAPAVSDEKDAGLKEYLERFVGALRELVTSNPGLTPYLLRRSASTSHISDKIMAHQQQVADVYGLSQDQACWLLSTVAFHCIAVADALYPWESEEARQADEAEVEAEFSQGMNALIVGALMILKQDQ